MTLQQRLQAPTPRFFRIIRNAGLLLAAVSAAILTAPIALPAVVVQVAGYLAVAGSVASAISQAVTSEAPEENQKGGNDAISAAY